MEIINPEPDDDGGKSTIPKTRKSKSPGAADLDGAWLSQCIRSGGKNSKPLPVLANALIGVRAVWPDAIAYDEMLCAPMLMQPLQGENDFTPRPLTDIDVGIMQDPAAAPRAQARWEGHRSPGRRHPRQRVQLPPGA